LVASGLAAAPALAAEPPAPGHQIISFPQRDFVSATGYVQGVDAYVEVIRGGVPIAISTPVQPEDDPATSGFDGLVEVNHPGGGCWSTTTGTPDIQPGDKIRVFQEQQDPSSAGAMISVADDTTTTAAVTAGRPVVSGLTVTIKGTAQGLDLGGNPTGAQIPLAQLEQRLINKDKFGFNGRRDLRAPRDGTLTYDSATAITWTAKYTLKSTTDVAKVNASESRVLWLGRNPGAGVESTIYENGTDVIAGPAAPCTAPLQGTTTAPQAPVAPAATALPNASGGVSAPVGPHSLIAFPSRDFISADGYTPGSNVSFSVLRNGTLVGQSDPIVVDDTGLAEVNHPGGGCWTADTQTPNIRPGDVVRITNLDSHVAEQTTVANVTVSKPTGNPTAGTVQVTGTAFNPDGTPMDLAQVEQRFVNTQKFSNGSRTLRAPTRGNLTAGATPGSFVASYTGLASADVTKALKGETRALWLGPAAAPATQLTIFELPDALSGVLNGVMDGPTPPCIAPAEIG